MEEENFLQSVPPITRFYCGGVLLTTIGIKLNFLSPLKIYFNPELIYQGEYWRLFSSFFFFGNFNLHFIFHMMFIYRYCKVLEEESYRGRTADFVFLFLFSGTLVLITGFVTGMMWLGMAFTQVFVYIWARRNPYTLLSFLGFIIRAPFIPWVFAGFSILLGGEVQSDLVGIVVGHVYYFLEDVFPLQEGGFKLLNTPEFMKRIFNENYVPPVEQEELDRLVAEERRTANEELQRDDLAENNNPGGYDFGGGNDDE